MGEYRDDTIYLRAMVALGDDYVTVMGHNAAKSKAHEEGKFLKTFPENWEEKFDSVTYQVMSPDAKKQRYEVRMFVTRDRIMRMIDLAEFDALFRRVALEIAWDYHAGRQRWDYFWSGYGSDGHDDIPF